MDTDIFGNLREWNDVPRQVAELIQRGELDEHQAGLVRILRYRHNWKLRELVLNAVKNLKVPTTGLMAELLGLVGNDDVYHEVRILAAQAFAYLFTNRHIESTDEQGDLLERLIESTRSRLDSLGPPVLQRAVLQCLESIENTRRTCRPGARRGTALACSARRPSRESNAVDFGPAEAQRR